MEADSDTLTFEVQMSGTMTDPTLTFEEWDEGWN